MVGKYLRRPRNLSTNLRIKAFGSNRKSRELVLSSLDSRTDLLATSFLRCKNGQIKCFLVLDRALSGAAEGFFKWGGGGGKSMNI